METKVSELVFDPHEGVWLVSIQKSANGLQIKTQNIHCRQMVDIPSIRF